MRDVQLGQINWLQNSEAFITKEEKIDFDGIPTLVVGVGGTGVDALVKVKHMYRLRFNDSQEIKFVGIDTDKNVVGAYAGDEMVSTKLDESKNEFIYLGSKFSEVANSSNYGSWSEEIKSFLEKDNGVEIAGDDGAGGVRLAGRTKFFASISHVASSLESLLTDVHNGASSKKYRVFILSGISGGTGSGGSLDVAYLIRALLAKKSIKTTDYDIISYLFMPDVNEAKSPQEYLKTNAYAYLKELEYLSTLKENGEKFSQKYTAGVKYEGDDGPYKVSYLLSSTTTDGLTGKGAYDYAMLSAAESILNTVIKPTNANETSAIELVDSNRNRIVELVKQESALKEEEGLMNRNYVSFGRVTFKMPTSEMLQYMTALSFEYMNRSIKNGAQENGLLQKTPDENSYVHDLEEMGLTFEKCRDYIMDYHERGETSEFSESTWISSPEMVVKTYSYDKIKADPELMYATIYKAVYREVAEKKFLSANPQRYQKFQQDIEKYLEKIRYSSEKGPLYLARLFGANLGGISSRSLMSQIGTLKLSLEETKSHHGKEASTYKNSATIALNEKPGLFGANKEKIAKKVIEYYVMSCQALRSERYFSAWMDCLTELEDFLRSKFRNDYEPVAEILYQIQDITASTLKNVRQNIVKEGTTNELTFATLPEMRDTLEASFAELNKSGAIEFDFLDYLKENIRLINSEESSRINIPKFLQEFFYKKFSDVISTKLEEILSWKAELSAGTIDSSEKLQNIQADKERLERYIGDHIINTMKEKSAPLFPIASPGTTTNAEHIKKSIFSDLRVSGEPANTMVNAILEPRFKAAIPNGEFSEVTSNNRMTQTSYLFGMPLYYYTLLDNMESAYELARKELENQHHLFALNQAGSDWSKLPNLTPYEAYETTDKHVSDKIVKEHEARKKVFEQALSAGIIYQEGDQFFLSLPDKEILLRGAKTEAAAFARFCRMHQNYYATLEALDKKSEGKITGYFVASVLTKKVYRAENSPAYNLDYKGINQKKILDVTDVNEVGNYLEKALFDNFLSILDEEQQADFLDFVDKEYQEFRNNNYSEFKESVFAMKTDYKQKVDEIKALSGAEKAKKETQSAREFYEGIYSYLETISKNL